MSDDRWSLLASVLMIYDRLLSREPLSYVISSYDRYEISRKVT